MTARKIMIAGPAGLLETIVEADSSFKKIVAIICHPHPLHEGTMHNKVVTTLVKVFQQLDIVPIRFNFRGVGESQGEHDFSVGELADLQAIIHWTRENFKDYQLILAGFSFGSYIATKVATEIKPLALITIAPPMHHNDFQSLPAIDFPWFVVQGEADDVVPPEQVFDWLDSLDKKPTIIKFPGVGHFFHGQLIPLREALIEALKPIIE